MSNWRKGQFCYIELRKGKAWVTERMRGGEEIEVQDKTATDVLNPIEVTIRAPIGNMDVVETRTEAELAHLCRWTGEVLFRRSDYSGLILYGEAIEKTALVSVHVGDLLTLILV